jgi:ribosomal protein S18 acetylase RimI-like enzyme
MAFLDSIRSFFGPVVDSPLDTVVPAPPTTYAIKPLTDKNAREVLRLNLRCFKNGENYTKYTFAYLFNEPRSLSYQLVTANGEMAAFAFVLLNHDGTAHLTTLGVAPEHRRRGLASRLLSHLDEVLRVKGVSTIVLEMRVGNLAARNLYTDAGYSIVNRIAKYYSDGEDCFLMVRSIV